jgi:hypothetical protein
MTNPTAYNTQNDLARDGVFLTRVKVAMTTQAVNVQAEANTTANHTNRANYAKLVLNSPDAYAPLFSNACVTQNDPATSALMTASISDANLGNVCSALWNALAGVI